MKVPALLSSLVLPLALVPALAPGQAQAAVCDPSRVMVVLDKSSSMVTGSIGGVTKWDIAVDALDGVLAEYDNQAAFGLMTFPQPSQCAPGELDVEPALASRAAIMDTLSTAPPSSGNWTPMAQTLDMAAGEPSLQPSDVNRTVILITDGWQWCSPYDPGTRFDGVDSITGLNQIGVTTYVVGFGGAVDTVALNQMAVVAGTARPGCDPSGDDPSDPNACYFQADSSAELIAALEFIAGTVSTETCDGIDNDCDGEIDEALNRDCETACGTGSEVCVAGDWVGCDAPAPETETCDGSDNDCDGTVDPGCDCIPGETRPCGGEETAGVCQPGTQTCDNAGTWGSCEGDVSPSAEMCDGEDNDCDGAVDEFDGEEFGTLCDWGYSCVDGECVEPDPVTPPTEDPVNPGEAGGSEVGGCCETGTSPVSALPLALGVMFAVGRRRRRRA